MSKRKVGFLLLFLFFKISFGSSQTINFSHPSEVCILEDLEVAVDEVAGGVSYAWSFCNEVDLSKYNYKRKIEAPGRSFYASKAISLNNKTYLLATDQKAKSILVYSFEEFSKEPQVFEVIGFSGSPKGIDIVQSGGNLYCVTSLSSGKLGVVKFDKDLTGALSIREFEGKTDPRHLEIVEDSGQYYVFVANTSFLAVYNFGDSFDDTPTVKFNPTTGFATGVSLKKHNGIWVGLVSRYSEGVFLLTFESGLDNDPTSQALPKISNPTEVNFLKINNELIATVATFNGGIKILKWNTQIDANPIISSVNYPELGQVISFNFFDLLYGQYGSGINNNASQIHIYEYDFCSANIQTSTASKEVIHYYSPGIKNIILTATDVEGNSSTITKQVTVLDHQAPKIEAEQENNCVSNLITLSAENLTPTQTITSYTWTFPDGSQQTGMEASHQFAEPGTYKVRLTVESENGCGNFIEKGVTVYAEPQAAYTLSANLACTNTGITFTNLTDFPEDSLISYSWDFGDGNTSAEKSPDHKFETSGTYAVVLSAIIPGCTTSSTQYVEVQSGPKTLFAASPVCDEQKVVFMNQTTGEDITGYEWELGDGTFSTVENPEHNYDAPGIYLVLLKSSNTLGCVSSFTQTLQVYSNPVPDFTTLPACAGSEVVFTDATTDADGNIETWKWSFEMADGTIMERTDQNPAVTYPEAGTYGVTLVAMTTWDCERSIRKTVVVKAVPEVAIGLEGGCLGAPSLLADWSETSGVKVQSWFWIVNNQVFTDSAFAYTFPAAGTYEVLLQLNLENGCSVRDTREVIIDPLPEVDFTYSGSCPGQIATFITSAQATEYVWTVDGKVIIGEGSELQYSFKELGPHTVSLTVQDVKGCSNTLSKEIEVVQPPLAAFTADRNKGVPPFEVQFTNGSEDGATYQWFFGAEQGSSEEEHPVYTFSEIGEYEVSLVTYNAAGCSDTATQRISVVEPKFDVVLHSVNMLQQNDQMQLVLSIENGGTIRVTDMDIEVLINNEFLLTEKFEGILEIGQKVNYPLRMQVNDSGKRKVRFICVELKPVLSLVSQELSVENNKKCPSLDQAFVMQEPFPNPGKDMVSLEFILPQPGTVSLTLYSVHGILVRQAELRDLKAHLNKVDLDVHGLGKGIYFLRARFGTEEVNYRIMKD